MGKLRPFEVLNFSIDYFSINHPALIEFIGNHLILMRKDYLTSQRFFISEVYTFLQCKHPTHISQLIQRNYADCIWI